MTKLKVKQMGVELVERDPIAPRGDRGHERVVGRVQASEEVDDDVLLIQLLADGNESVSEALHLG